MKKRTKTSQKKQSFRNVKKASYIGAVFIVVLCGIGLILATRLPDMALSVKETSPLPLPTPPTAEIVTPPAPLPSEQPLTTPIPSPSPQIEEKAVAVASTPETLQIALPVEGEVIVPFSGEQLVYSKTLQDWRAHPGIDISASAGTDVKASADGTVAQLYYDAQMGYTIILRHGELYQTVYQNLADTKNVTQGQTIKRGESIGKVGTSASAELIEDSHIHFAVLAGETFQNPLEFLINP
ncbi:MAG: M23 family metallopeptidase [Ruminococcaceae bacterium]|nr:M23 family metallopeptidase [Oscillospiraceae bacterium]